MPRQKYRGSLWARAPYVRTDTRPNWPMAEKKGERNEKVFKSF